jgi:hypothetical protein
VDPRKEAFDRLLRARASRLGVTLEQARQVAARRAQYSVAAEKEAAMRGVPTQKVLDEDIEAMRASTYPSPECLSPADVEDFIASQRLSAEARDHITNCEACLALLAEAEPMPEMLEDFMKLVCTELNELVAAGQEFVKPSKPSKKK